jgi:uncharacterized repeat protein (TIGR01451 family)
MLFYLSSYSKRFKMKRLIPLVLLAILFASSGFINSQTVPKTYTFAVFSDANNNCNYDAGEYVFPIFPYQVGTNPCFNIGQGGLTTCTTGGIVQNTLNTLPSCVTYAVDKRNYLSWIQPCANYSAVPFGGTYYLPINPTKTVSPILDISWGISNNSWKILQNGYFDTIKTCNTINAKFYQVSMRDFINCSAIYSGTISLKLDGVVYDNIAIPAVSITNSVVSLASGTGTIMMNSGGCDFSYNFNPTITLPSGTHTMTAEYSAPPGYSQPAVIGAILYVDSCGQVAGNTWVDCNLNCIKDFSETYATSGVTAIKLTNPTHSYTAFPDFNGNFAVNAAIGTYTLSTTSPANFSLCLPSTTVNVTTATTFSYNYGIKQLSASSSDHMTSLFLANGVPGPGAVPGGTIDVHVNNNLLFSTSCGTFATATKLKVLLDPMLSYLSPIAPTTAPSTIIPSAAGDTLIWNFPGSNASRKFKAVVSTSATIGNPYCIQSAIYPTSDLNPLNNTMTVCRLFGGPFDPNSKESFHPNMMSNGDIPPATQDLTYMIQFQNLGNGPAVNVTIIDTIDTNLDINSFMVLNSGFPVQVQLDPATRIVHFKFNNIYLPDSTSNEPGSHGFVTYNIKLNTGLPIGTQLKNTAHIYFDYNSAVTTNTTKNTLAVPLSVKELKSADAFYVYPNPAATELNIFTVNGSETEIDIFDIRGQFMRSEKRTHSNIVNIQISDLAPGMYIVNIKAGGSSKRIRFVKQ